MSEKKVGKRLLTWVLVLVMTLSLLPLNVLANEGGEEGTPETSTKYSTENQGAQLVKSATKNADGTYTIQLESWVTGMVEQTTGSAPLDIVLVLDQSGSMEGEKLQNLKTAVTSFVTAINDNATKNNVEHRIAIVGFASNQTEGGSNWESGAWYNTGIFVNGQLKNYQTYQREGNREEVYLTNENKPEDGYEYQAWVNGWWRTLSYNESESSWGYYSRRDGWKSVTPKSSSNDYERDHVQVYRKLAGGYIDLKPEDYRAALVASTSTDITAAINNLAASGATRASYGMEMANNVFANNALREGSSRVVVFFTDGEPGQNGYETSEAGRAIAQAHTTKNTYGAKVFSVGMIADAGGDVDNFMNYVSSNYPNAQSMDSAGEQADAKYYMNVTSGDLSAVFQQISGSILKPSVEADGDTILTDTLSQYFAFGNATDEAGTPTNATVKKVAYQGSNTWANDGEDITSSVAVNFNEKAVTVRNFDYSSKENVVTDGATPSGYKLVVTFNVKPDTNCTNWGASGEYDTNSGSATLAKGNSTFATVASPDAAVETYQVTYRFEDEAPVDPPEDSQHYISGQQATVKQPGDPDNTGTYTYNFNGWTNNGESVGNTVPINKADVELIGTWEKTANTAQYTVKHLEKGTNKVLHAQTGGTKNIGEAITSANEKINIDGYNYDSVDKETLTIGTGENVINIYYTKRNDLSYTVNYLEKTTNKVLHEPKTVGNQTFGAEVKSSDEKIDIDGYNFDSVDKDTLTIGTGENVINLYYTKRTDLSYTVNYLEKGTDAVLHTAKTADKQTFGTVISSADEAITIDGYTYDSADKDTLTIGTGENVINLYYTKRTDLSYTVNYLEKGTNAVLHEQKVQTGVTFGTEVTSADEKINIAGYNYDSADKESLTIGTGENVINLYYTKITGLKYTVNYLWNNSAIQSPTTGVADYGDIITLINTDISGYTIKPNQEIQYSIKTDERVINLYYYKNVELTAKSDTVTYDGKEHTVTGYTGAPDGANFNNVSASGSGTAVGDYAVKFNESPINKLATVGAKEYIITKATDGKLTITGVTYYPPYYPPTVEIEDDDALGLNTTDHFAYIVGYGNGEVRPQNNITRAEVATIFFRLLTDDVRDENLTKTNRYSDVAATAWYNTAVSTLSSMGIITGYPDGTFRPNAAITRAEFAAIAARFDNDGDKTAAKFSDIATHWAKDEISIAYNNGWITGYPDGTFGPQRDITRAETMTLVNRVLNRQPETEEDLLPNMTVWTDNANPKAWYYLAVQEATNSHYYEFKTNSKYEKWTELRETRDWTQLEK